MGLVNVPKGKERNQQTDELIQSLEVEGFLIVLN